MGVIRWWCVFEFVFYFYGDLICCNNLKIFFCCVSRFILMVSGVMLIKLVSMRFIIWLMVVCWVVCL